MSGNSGMFANGKSEPLFWDFLCACSSVFFSVVPCCEVARGGDVRLKRAAGLPARRARAPGNWLAERLPAIVSIAKRCAILAERDGFAGWETRRRVVQGRWWVLSREEMHKNNWFDKRNKTAGAVAGGDDNQYCDENIASLRVKVILGTCCINNNNNINNE